MAAVYQAGGSCRLSRMEELIQVVQFSPMPVQLHNAENTNTSQMRMIFPPLAANLVQNISRWQRLGTCTAAMGNGCIFKRIIIMMAFMFIFLTTSNTDLEIKRSGMDRPDVISASTLALERFWAVRMGALESVHHWHNRTGTSGETCPT